MMDMDLSGAEMGAEGEVASEAPAEMDLFAAYGVALACAAKDAAFVEAAQMNPATLTANEDGSITLTAGEASLTVPASEIMGEPEEAMAEAQEEVAEVSSEASAEGGE